MKTYAPIRALSRSGLLLACALLAVQQVQAMSFGSPRVLSFFGQPLSVEIDLNEVNPAEAVVLTVRNAPLELYQNQGLTAPPTALGVETTLRRRENGQYYIELSSSLPVNASSLSLAVQVVVGKDYTMARAFTLLLDIPKLPPPSALQGI